AVPVLAAAGPPLCRPRCRRWTDGGAAASRGVHRQVAGTAGGAGTSTRSRVRANHLLGGGPGAGRVLVEGPQRASRQVSERAGGRERVLLRSSRAGGVVGGLPHPCSRTASAHRRVRRGSESCR